MRGKSPVVSVWGRGGEEEKDKRLGANEREDISGI